MEQEGNFLVVLFLLSLITISKGTDGTKQSETNYGGDDSLPKLFVFGDSFVDTGNRAGEGKRFSNGLCMTDHIASFLGIKTPVAYSYRNSTKNKSQLQYGMNFAFGGTALSNKSWYPEDMQVQIGYLKQQIDEKVYTKKDIENSVALIINGGNEYTYYVQELNGTMKGVHTLTREVVSQITKDLRELRKIGVKRVAMFGLPLRGCYPKFTTFVNYRHCNESWEQSSKYHDKLLRREIEQLNKESTETKFLYLDLQRATREVLDEKKTKPEYYNPILKPCCAGVNHKYFCRMQDENGKDMYTVCKNPQLHVLWDMAHPTQEGAFDIYLRLLPELSRL